MSSDVLWSPSGGAGWGESEEHQVGGLGPLPQFHPQQLCSPYLCVERGGEDEDPAGTSPAVVKLHMNQAQHLPGFEVLGQDTKSPKP